MDRKKLYRPRLFYLLPILSVPLILAGGLLLLGESVNKDFIVGIFLFILAILVPVFLVIGNKVEVDDGNESVIAYLFGIKILELTHNSVRKIHEGYLFPIIPKGGGFGEGIIIYASYKGKPRILRMGIRLYGKEAVDHVKSILEKKNIRERSKNIKSISSF